MLTDRALRPSEVAQSLEALVANLERVIIGKRWAVELAVASLAAGGHLLLQDVPGVGKTVLARALAKSIGGLFKRIQCTADLLPSDITGGMVYDAGRGAMRFVPGPIFAHVVLADELNRTTPRAQAALLEAMDETQVTAEGTTYPLPRPFFLIATLNPLEHHGTYPLPEGELDRFLASVSLGYLSRAQEVEVVIGQVEAHPLESLRAVVDPDHILRLQASTRQVHLDRSLMAYAVEVVAATRNHTEVILGASPRASLGLVRLAQAWALIHGREFVLPDDIKALAPVVLSHRLVLHARGGSRSEIVHDVLAHVTVPV